MVGESRERYLTSATAAATASAAGGTEGSVASVAGEVGDVAAFQWQLESCRLGLVAAVQEVLLEGPGGVVAGGGGGGGDVLRDVHGLWCELLGVWRKIKQFEEVEAEEAAQLFKTKTQSTTFMTEEVGGMG
jgi:hypothetical protein